MGFLPVLRHVHATCITEWKHALQGFTLWIFRFTREYLRRAGSRVSETGSGIWKRMRRGWTEGERWGAPASQPTGIQWALVPPPRRVSHAKLPELQQPRLVWAWIKAPCRWASQRTGEDKSRRLCCFETSRSEIGGSCSDIFLSCSAQFSRSVMSDSLQPHEPQHAGPPCPSPTPGVHPNPCPWSRWCHPAISSSVIRFSSCPQSVKSPLLRSC